MNAQCGAKKRGKDETCRGIAMANGRCRLHGGKQPQGIARPGFVTGRYSKYLPSRLVGRYEEAISDPDLLALRDDIGLLDTRLAGVVARLETGESKEAWETLAFAWGEFASSWKDMPPDDMERTVERISTLVTEGLSEGYVWQEIRGLLKERSALVGAEQKRLVEMQQYVTATQAMGFVASVMASVRKHVSDRRALAAIASDLTGLSLRPGRESA